MAQNTKNKKQKQKQTQKTPQKTKIKRPKNKKDEKNNNRKITFLQYSACLNGFVEAKNIFAMLFTLKQLLVNIGI